MKSRFWNDSLGRNHALICEDVNEDGTLGIFHIPYDCCLNCRKKITPYKNDYYAMDILTLTISHYNYKNNYCKNCAKAVTDKLNRIAAKSNVYHLETESGAFTNSGYHGITFIQSKGQEVSAYYDPDCERVETYPKPLI